MSSDVESKLICHVCQDEKSKWLTSFTDPEAGLWICATCNQHLQTLCMFTKQEKDSGARHAFLSKEPSFAAMLATPGLLARLDVAQDKKREYLETIRHDARWRTTI